MPRLVSLLWLLSFLLCNNKLKPVPCSDRSCCIALSGVPFSFLTKKHAALLWIRDELHH
uniref:Uncharacterized protein n=1 Tax=Arundo donax TaxID=35708 RepID=A0A0A9GMQ4_ARUDO